MRYTITLSENDFLQYQLFAASRNDRVKKQLTRGRVINFIFFMCIGYFFFSSGNRMLGGYFILIGVLMIILFPLYSKWRYRNYFKKSLKESFANRMDNPEQIEILGNAFCITREAVDQAVPFSDIESFSETGAYFFLHFTSADPLIIPKDNINDPARLKTKLFEIAATENIPLHEELNWKW